MVDPFPLIIWLGMLVFCIHWLINAIKMKIKYEIAAALGIFGYFTAAFLGQYFISIYDNLITGLIGIIIIIFGFSIFISQIIIMKRLGQAENWENTTRFIEKGWFKYIRHPMYFGCAIADIGIIIWIPSWFSIIIGACSIIFCYLSSKWEDQSNIKKFGENYIEYQHRVKLWGIL